MNGDPGIVIGASVRSRTMADGTLRVEIDVEPRDAPTAFQLFHSPGTPVALARVTNKAAQAAADRRLHEHEADQEGAALVPAEEKGPYGQFATLLYRSNWLHGDGALALVGTDDEFVAWVRTQPCEWCGAVPQARKIDPAHVRRVELGSGTAEKPPYGVIPLCNPCHRAQHQHGEETCFGSKGWMERTLRKTRTNWVKQCLYELFEVNSLTDIDPVALAEWVYVETDGGHGGAWLALPEEYRNALTAQESADV